MFSESSNLYFVPRSPQARPHRREKCSIYVNATILMNFISMLSYSDWSQQGTFSRQLSHQLNNIHPKVGHTKAEK